jgi:hypothetical protein
MMRSDISQFPGTGAQSELDPATHNWGAPKRAQVVPGIGRPTFGDLSPRTTTYTLFGSVKWGTL